MVGRPTPILIFLIFLNFSADFVYSRDQQFRDVKCSGTSSMLSVGQNRLDHYAKMAKRYRNCTIVEGNLEITGLERTNLDVSFLKDIEVVTGYVIIALNYVSSLSLENLRLIRGRKLYDGKYALYISVNRNSQDPDQRLEYLNLKSLTEISNGNIKIEKNFLCFVNTVEWNDILSPQPRLGKNWMANITNTPPENCGECDDSCNGKCWGEGPDMCQKLTRLICSPDCDRNSRCMGPSRSECCNKECSSGCTGPTDRDCLLCRHVNDSGSCQSSCPPDVIYDPQTQRNIPNPDFKYHYYDRCVDKCPSNLLVEDNSCVTSCRLGQHNNGSGVCVPCTAAVCEKECFGVGHSDGLFKTEQAIHSLNIHYLDGCNIINGNLVFLPFSFIGDSHREIPPMNVSQLQALRNIKNITGYLQISSWHKNLSDLSAFENLRFIGGVNLYQKLVSFIVSTRGDYLSQITSLGLRSLKVIAHGNIYIHNLDKLCYADTIAWEKIIKDPTQRKGYPHGAKVRVGENCSVTCDVQCSSSGCWGPGPKNCLSCKNVSYNGTCMSECKKELRIFAVPEATECQACHPECRSTCNGEGPSNCTKCKHFDLNGTCVSICPIQMYGNDTSGKCLPCSNSCALHQDSRMCTGPSNILGDGGCNYCEYAVTSQTFKIARCLPSGSTCPSAHFRNSKSATYSSANYTCVPCYEGCSNCSGIRKEDCLHPLPIKTSKAIVVVSILIPLILVICGLVILFMVCRNRKKTKKRRRLHSMRALGIDMNAEEMMNTDQRTRLMEPMTPSGVAPNQAQLRIVKEADLRIGKILGSGAFGTVHKGYWIPDLAQHERVKVPVAIKVLRDESSQVANNEILDEAMVMASCEHPNLVRLLGISLAQRIMLITQLMPLGNLLDYVRENKDNIGSQHLINWSLQIAKGMRYLAEDKHLVHRDLAARNVLVKSPNHVRITDFGLAKLLDVNEDVYRAEGGKMPIKWLAIESIQRRIFTQKSDVWSFGVTMWELLTFGKRPYEDVSAREVFGLLESGQRLPQPQTSTIEIYMMLLKCWTVDMEARPTFRELVEELSKMARDPPRFIVVNNEGTLTDLPSPTTSEFLQSLMNEEGDDFPITDAEDYLYQPAFSAMDPNGGSQFPLQPAPSTVPWKRHHDESVTSPSSQQPFFGNQSGKTFSKWRRPLHDERSDSAVTTVTSLSTISEPNGNRNPFSFGGNSLEPCEEVVLGPDNLPMAGFNEHPKTRDIIIEGRNLSDSSDVFDSPKQADTNNQVGNGCTAPDQPTSRLLRSREDSTNLRYSAEPVSRLRQQQQQIQQAKLNGPKPKSFITQDEEGYLCPSEAANKKPEYLDPGEPSSRQHSTDNIALLSALENPDYDCTFAPNGSQDPYELQLDHLLAAPGSDKEYCNMPSAAEYQNLNCSDGREDTLSPPPRHESVTSEESESIKRDSGMQSGEESEKPKTAVSNPNYETLDDVHQTQLPNNCGREEINYVNVATEKPQFRFGDDDIFNANLQLTKEGRTYSEPDSGVGIDVGMDNVMYHKFPYP